MCLSESFVGDSVQLLNACANYRSVLLSLSKATSQFADAMEACSRYEQYLVPCFYAYD